MFSHYCEKKPDSLREQSLSEEGGDVSLLFKQPKAKNKQTDTIQFVNQESF